jgi:hypothetical protein
MQDKKKFPKVGAFQEHAIHVSKIRKLEEACDSAVAQYIEDKINDVHNPKIDEALKDKLGCAEKSIQSSIRRIGELEKAFVPTPIQAEKFKKQIQGFQDGIKKFSADAERMRTMFHNGLKYDGKNDEPCDMFPENNGGINPLNDFPKNRREEMIEHLLTSRVKYQDIRGSNTNRSNSMGYIGNSPQVEIDKERLKVERERLALDREKFEWQKNQEPSKPKKKKQGRTRKHEARINYCEPEFKKWFDKQKWVVGKQYYLDAIFADFKASEIYAYLDGDIADAKLNMPCDKTLKKLISKYAREKEKGKVVLKIKKGRNPDKK